MQLLFYQDAYKQGKYASIGAKSLLHASDFDTTYCEVSETNM